MKKLFFTALVLVVFLSLDPSELGRKVSALQDFTSTVVKVGAKIVVTEERVVLPP